MLPGKRLIFCLVFVFFSLYASQSSNCVLAAEEESLSGEVILETDLLAAQKEAYAPDGEYIKDDGETYWLKEWSLIPYQIPERKRKVKKMILCQKVEWEGQIPAHTLIIGEDELTGQKMEEVYPVLEKTFLREYWVPEFSFQVIFHSYDAEYFQIGSKEVALNERNPGLEKYSQELLEEIGVNPKRYRILEAAWEGEPFQDSEGVFCREAVVTGEKMVSDYDVTYGGEMVFPETEGVRCRAVYRGFDNVTDGWNIAEEQPVNLGEGEKKEKKSWLVFQKSVIVTLSLLFLGGLILILIIAVRKIKKQRRSE